MVDDSVLRAIALTRADDGSIINTGEDLKDDTDVPGGFEFAPLYVLDYTHEYDRHCKMDTTYNMGHILSNVLVPYQLVIPPKRKSANPTLYMTNVVRYALDYCHACKIGGLTAFLVLPDCEHAYGNFAATGRNICDVPGLVTNLYYSGVSGALMLLNRLLPNRTTREAEEFLKQLDAALEYRSDLHFERDYSVTAFSNGEVLCTNYYARKAEDVHGQLPPIRPEDHILASAVLPVAYDPTITSDALALRIFKGWFGEPGTDKWNRGIELEFGGMFALGFDDKGVTVNIGDGGFGKSTINKVRRAIFGEESVTVCGKGINGLKDNGVLGGLEHVRAFVVDEVPEGPLANDTLTNIKTLSTGETVDYRPHYTHKKVPVGHFAIVMNGNHFPEISPREAGKNQIARRFHPYLFHTNFDDASIDDASKRLKRSDLIIELCHDEHAKSCILNWILAAVERMVVRQGYTPVKEDIDFRNIQLGEMDLMSDFLESIGGIFGTNLGYPTLYRFAGGDEMVVYPAHHSCDKTCRVYDTTNDSVHTLSEMLSYKRRLICETATLHKLYMQYCTDCGVKAQLKRSNFKAELVRLGYDEIRTRDPFGRMARIIVPAGTEPTADGFADFRRAQAAEHANIVALSGDDPIKAANTADKAAAIDSETAAITANADFRNAWQPVLDICLDAADKNLKGLDNLLPQGDLTSIDTLEQSAAAAGMDQSTLMSIFRAGIRAMQTTHHTGGADDVQQEIL